MLITRLHLGPRLKACAALISFPRLSAWRAAETSTETTHLCQYIDIIRHVLLIRELQPEQLCYYSNRLRNRRLGSGSRKQHKLLSSPLHPD
jgi:hypothetical protein